MRYEMKGNVMWSGNIKHALMKNFRMLNMKSCFYFWLIVKCSLDTLHFYLQCLKSGFIKKTWNIVVVIKKIYIHIND